MPLLPYTLATTRTWYCDSKLGRCSNSFLSESTEGFDQATQFPSIEAAKLQEYTLTQNQHTVSFLVEMGWHHTQSGHDAYNRCLGVASDILLKHNPVVNCGQVMAYDCTCDFHTAQAAHMFATR
jgi:hypothetical protein